MQPSTYVYPNSILTLSLLLAKFQGLGLGRKEGSIETKYRQNKLLVRKLLSRSIRFTFASLGRKKFTFFCTLWLHNFNHLSAPIVLVCSKCFKQKRQKFVICVASLAKKLPTCVGVSQIHRLFVFLHRLIIH